MSGPQPPSVLLVDDTPDIRGLVRMALERRGDFQVVAEAENGATGIEAAREHHPDVVLLDIAMPVMDGLEALPKIREACPDATVIMLSGFGAEQMVQRALASGADGYLQKGLPIRSLLAGVHELVEARTPGSSGSGGGGDVVHRDLGLSRLVALVRGWWLVPAIS